MKSRFFQKKIPQKSFVKKMQQGCHFVGLGGTAMDATQKSLEAFIEKLSVLMIHRIRLINHTLFWHDQVR